MSSRSAFIIMALCGLVGCPQRRPPNFGPPAGITDDDQYIYSFGSFSSPYGLMNIESGGVRPGDDAPIIWIRGEAIDLNQDTPQTIIERCGKPDDESYRKFSYNGSSVIDTAARIYLGKDGKISRITIGKGGGLSLDKSSEVLTIPFTRDELKRVFGPPQEFIKAGKLACQVDIFLLRHCIPNGKPTPSFLPNSINCG